MNTVYLALIGFVSSFILTALILKLTHHFQVMDIPNHRSSHNVPTPKGGGFAIAMVTVLALLWLWYSRGGLQPSLLAIAVGGALLAVTGLVDDLKGLSAPLRFLIQVTVALVFLVALAVPPKILLGDFNLPIPLCYICGFIWLLWSTNLYNFMDGIDGIAGLQGVLVAASIFVLAQFQQQDIVIWFVPLMIAASCLGFLVFNFPPAKIFMGDTGSAFLGFIFAALSLQQAVIDSAGFWVWLILLALFVIDASITLLTRMITGQRFYEAHNKHLFQRYIRHMEKKFTAKGIDSEQARTQAHRYCLGIFTVLFCLWLFPLATLVTMDFLHGFYATIIAYLPLFIFAIIAGAGKSHSLIKFSTKKKH